MVNPLEIAEQSIGLLEKAAQEADALEAENRNLRAANAELVKRCEALTKSAAARPTTLPLDNNLLMKLATVLADAGMLAEDMTAEKLANIYQGDPNQLAKFALHILRPASADGQPTKAAALRDPHVKIFEGREVYDPYGFTEVLK